MIGKSEWFERRKYGGWGITPKTWQGYVYIIGFVVSLSFFMALPIWDLKTRYIILGVWLLVFFADVIDIMRNMKKDERDTYHEAIAERNALWGVMSVLILGLVYQLIQSTVAKEIIVDWWIVAAVFVGLIVKSVTNYYLDKNN